MLEDGVKRLRTTLKQVRLKEASCDCNKQQQQLTRSKLPLVLPCPLLRSSPELSTDKSIEAKPVESYELQQQTDFMNRVRQDRSKLLRRKESDFLAIASSAGLLKDQATGEEEVRVKKPTEKKAKECGPLTIPPLPFLYTAEEVQGEGEEEDHDGGGGGQRGAV